MSIKEVLAYFGSSVEAYSPMDVVLILSAALVGGLVVFATYRFTTDSAIYNRNFNVGNVVITIITAVIMMMISSNIVISLGMVGALSIVRFRTAVKEARDTVFIFWAIVLGLCAGSQNFVLAGISALFIAALFFIFSLTSMRRGGYTLIVRSHGANAEEIEKAVKAGAVYSRLRALHTSEEDVEYVYKLRGTGAKCAELTQKLRKVEGVAQANLVEAEGT